MAPAATSCPGRNPLPGGARLPGWSQGPAGPPPPGWSQGPAGSAPPPGWSQGPAGSAPPPGWSQSPPSWSQGLPSWGQTVGAGGGYGPGRPTAGSSRTGPLPMYPMAVGDILDATFRLLRANAKASCAGTVPNSFPLRGDSCLQRPQFRVAKPAVRQFGEPAATAERDAKLGPDRRLLDPFRNWADDACRSWLCLPHDRRVLPRRAVPVRPSSQDKPGRDTRFDRL